MRSQFRTLARAISTLVVLFVLVFGAGLDALAQGNSRWGRSHNRGRHLGWYKQRRRNNTNWDWRRAQRRDRRFDRREVRRDRRELRRDRRELRRDRRSSYGSDRSVLEQRLRQQRADLRQRQRTDRDLFRESRGRGRH
ncbi:MAG TPA: hypothetical protein VJ866_02285 [Pyrinomonadaceae bacterium]|nr:hypothetical protein [Pyrinomonadaceae bacterium]